jgi:hypothetical protein
MFRLFTHLSADYRLRHIVNNVAMHIYAHDYIKMEITVLLSPKYMAGGRWRLSCQSLCPKQSLVLEQCMLNSERMTAHYPGLVRTLQ